MYFFSHNPGLREPDGSLTPRYSLPPRNGAFGFGGRLHPMLPTWLQAYSKRYKIDEESNFEASTFR